jgi:hypothetical protein
MLWKTKITLLIELIKLNLGCIKENILDEANKLKSSLIKLLKKMKEDSRIQFFADSHSFELNTTESEFLINKYPEVFANKEIISDEGYYIKL